MSFKKFSSKDLVYNVIKTNPKSVFSIRDSIIYYQYQSASFGAPGFEDEHGERNKLNHVPSGHISLHEMNVDRPANQLSYKYLVRSSDNEALPPISSEAELNNIPLGQEMSVLYPMSASISRIFIPSGIEFDVNDPFNPGNILGTAHENKKYIRALKNVIESQENVSSGLGNGNLGTQAVNMICIPGIFYGSKINPGSIDLEYYIGNNRIGKVQDHFSDGRLMEVSSGENPTYRQVGLAIYNQGLLLLTSSLSLGDQTLSGHGTGEAILQGRDFARWINFGSGIPMTGRPLLNVNPGTVPSYKISFEGTNNIPTLTMYAYSKLGDDNYSHNPTFLTSSRAETIRYNSSSFYQEEVDIKKVNKSDYEDAEEDFQNVTYISKIGIYDRFKNLIAIASLSRPIKKTEKRDYMFKIGIDF